MSLLEIVSQRTRYPALEPRLELGRPVVLRAFVV